MTIAAVAFIALILASSSSLSLTTEIGCAATPFTSLTRIVFASSASAAAGSAAPAPPAPSPAERPSRAVAQRRFLRFMTEWLLVRGRGLPVLVGVAIRRSAARRGTRSAQALLEGLQVGEGAPRVAVGLGPARVETDLHREVAGEVDVLERLQDAVPVDGTLPRRSPVGVGEVHVGQMGGH